MRRHARREYDIVTAHLPLLRRYGPGAPYHKLLGRDATRALATMELIQVDLAPMAEADMDADELKTLRCAGHCATVLTHGMLTAASLSCLPPAQRVGSQVLTEV